MNRIIILILAAAMLLSAGTASAYAGELSSNVASVYSGELSENSVESAEGTENTESAESAKTEESAENSEDSENSEGSEGSGSADGADDTDIIEKSGVADDTENAENTDDAETENNSTIPFPDIPENAWYLSYVSELTSDGVICGYEDGTFRPNGAVTWGEALKLIILASGYSEQNPVADDANPDSKMLEKLGTQSNHWASGYLRYAINSKAVSEDSIPELNTAITRSEIAELVASILNLESSPTGVSEVVYSDNTDTAPRMLYAAGIMEGSLSGENRTFNGQSCISRAELSAVISRIQGFVDENILIFGKYHVFIYHDLAVNSLDTDSFSIVNTRVVTEKGSEIAKGIDVSFYQGEINWKKVAKDGIDFAIIRAGFRGCTAGSLNEDDCFRRNIEGALKYGIDVGAYFFSQAVTAEEAIEEAEYLLNLVKGYKITYPLVFDWEPLSSKSSRTRNYTGEMMTIAALAFCERISAAGYTPAVYLNETQGYLYYDLSRIMRYDIWLAHYTSKTDFYYDFEMWQYTSSGTVSGINGRVDMNIAVKKYG